MGRRIGVRRAWKNHDFGALDVLKEQALIVGTYSAKSIFFTPKGEARALELLQQYFGKEV